MSVGSESAIPICVNKRTGEAGALRSITVRIAKAQHGLIGDFVVDQKVSGPVAVRERERIGGVRWRAARRYRARHIEHGRRVVEILVVGALLDRVVDFLLGLLEGAVVGRAAADEAVGRRRFVVQKHVAEGGRYGGKFAAASAIFPWPVVRALPFIRC